MYNELLICDFFILDYVNMSKDLEGEIAKLLYHWMTNGFNRALGALRDAKAIDTSEMDKEYTGVGSMYYDMVSDQMKLAVEYAQPSIRKLVEEERLGQTRAENPLPVEESPDEEHAILPDHLTEGAVRSVRLSDEVWAELGRRAKDRGMSRAECLQRLIKPETLYDALSEAEYDLTGLCYGDDMPTDSAQVVYELRDAIDHIQEAIHLDDEGL